jgi:hypothetical protein
MTRRPQARTLASSAGALARRLGLAALREGLLPLALSLAALALVSDGLLWSPGASVARDFYDISPRDWHGTVWFYGWVEQALARGMPILEPDIVCAPQGQALGSNFPNWLDAILAAPLFRWWSFPASYNLFTLLVPVIDTLAAFFALRAFTQNRWLATLLALVYGFNFYTFQEISVGRTSTSLLFVVPLFIGAWARALRRPGRWAWAWGLAAAVAGALTVYYHPFFALGCVLFGLLLALGALLMPAAGVGRVRPLQMGALVVLVGLFLASPYLYQVGYLQNRVRTLDSAQLDLPRSSQAPWSPAVWRFLTHSVSSRLAEADHPRSGDTLEPRELERLRYEIQMVSLPVDFPLWGTVPARTSRGRVLGWAFLLLVLGGGVAARWRGLGWLLSCSLLWILCCGPWAASETGSYTILITRDGQELPLLWYGLVEPLQEFVGFIKPTRLYPHFLLAFTITAALGAEATLGWLGDRPWFDQPRWRRWALLALLPALLAAPRLLQLGEPVPAYLGMEPWAPDPFLTELAEDPEGGAIIELPLGIGHGSSPLQLVHGRKRADSHADSFHLLQQGAPPAGDCLAPGLPRLLWGYGCVPTRPDLQPWNSPQALELRRPEAAPRLFTRSKRSQAREQGFELVLVYPQVYRKLQERSGGDLRCEPEAVIDELEAVLGPPRYRSDEIVAFDLAGASAPVEGP